nr:unnamed protein product [Spirometra erinaceieuropaei]
MVSWVNEVAKSVGLSINAGKTKVFSSCIPDQENAPLGIDGCQLEEVDTFKYLGARLLPNGQSKDDIVLQINAARWVFSSLRKRLWNRRDLSIATKIRMYRASVRSVLLYGCECWALRVEDERKLKPSEQSSLNNKDEPEHSLVFVSQTLTTLKRNYSTTRKELLPVVTFVKKFPHRLTDKQFILSTDKQALRGFENFKDPTGQLAGSQADLLENSDPVVHRARSKHQNADALSSRTQTPPPFDAYATVTAISSLTPEYLRFDIILKRQSNPRSCDLFSIWTEAAFLTLRRPRVRFVNKSPEAVEMSAELELARLDTFVKRSMSRPRF